MTPIAHGIQKVSDNWFILRTTWNNRRVAFFGCSQEEVLGRLRLYRQKILEQYGVAH
jgi:hypothetical protein